MLRAVIKKEFLSHFVSFRFQTSSIVMLVLAVLAAIVGSQDYAQRLDRYTERVEAHQEELKRVSVYSFLYPKVFKIPEPLSVLDTGFEVRLGNQVTVDVFSFPRSATGGGFREHWISVRDFDLTTIVRVVLGLLALLLTFDAVSGERERGTLRLVFANSITRSRVLIGKFLGAFAALLIPLLASLVASALIMSEYGQVTLDSERWMRILGLLGGYVLYLTIMLLVGIHLSLLARSSSAALVYSLVTWLVVVFLIPQSAVAVASVVARGGEPASIHREALNHAREERNEAFAKLAAEFNFSKEKRPFQAPVTQKTAQRGELLRFGSPRLYNRKADYFARQTKVGMDFVERMAALGRSEDERLQKAERLAWTLALPSPAFLLDRVSESLVGTSFDDHERFLEDARSFRETFIAYLERKGAFGSWQWFTDDNPDSPEPWPTLLGRQPEDVTEDEIEQLIATFLSTSFQDEISKLNKQFDFDPDRQLDLSDLPQVDLSQVNTAEAMARVAAELGTLALVCLVLALVAGYRFHSYPLR